MPEKIGILTGGGDCAGLNAVIAAIVKAGIPMGYEFAGFERGWEGILDPVMYRPLTREAVRGISHLGGTILKTTNKGRFTAKAGMGDHSTIDPEILAMAARNLGNLGVSGLIVIGGDGTLSGAVQLAEHGIKIVGVPKTIDNDLCSTDQTFGFSTAVQVAVEALDKLHTTADSHERTILVECMGRHAGWISLYAGVAGGANAILLPEFPFELENLIAFLRRRRQQGRSAVVVVAEGIAAARADTGSATREARLGGVALSLMQEIEHASEDELEVRTVVLGHTQRGGQPNAEDRILAKKYGVAAIEAYAEGKFNHMVALRGGILDAVPIETAVESLKLVTDKEPVYQTALKTGIFIR
jgi:6-phosphofructokinase